MKYCLRKQAIAAVLLLLLIGLTIPVMASSNVPVTPPGISTLAPISLSPELREKYSEQTKLVKVKATVAADGIIEGDVKVVLSSGDAAFDQAVVEALQKSVFTPAYTGDNQAVACSIILPLNVNVEKYVPEEEVTGETEQTKAGQ
ncbi:TonB family protein [Sporomusa aerivorans]|uniref:TonB family protein n=1 Tax=Sporomusa aerivorans TaxID=204936 RepID=UPI00352AE019